MLQQHKKLVYALIPTEDRADPVKIEPSRIMMRVCLRVVIGRLDYVQKGGTGCWKARVLADKRKFLVVCQPPTTKRRDIMFNKSTSIAFPSTTRNFLRTCCPAQRKGHATRAAKWANSAYHIKHIKLAKADAWHRDPRHYTEKLRGTPLKAP
jgi:hypothetical protein